MKKELQDQLKKYSATAAAVVATGSAADAQIVYNQVNKTLTASVANPIAVDSIDINTDGNYDIFMRVDDYTYPSYSISAGIVYGGPMNYQGHALAGSVASSYNYPFKLSNGNGIKSQQFLPADSAGSFALYYNGSSPFYSHWNGGVTDGFLGVKLQIGSNTHYGWVRMDVSTDARQVVIKDMAYNSTPDADINAGENGLSLDKYRDIANGVWIHDKTLFTDIPVGFTTGSIELIDMGGKKIHEVSLAEKKSEFALSTLPSGTYVLSLKLDGNTFNKQVVVK